MDPVSQAALGAAWAEPAAPRSKARVAAATGSLAGMAPDLDVLIGSSSDPLLALEYHRHFTHALAFVPFGALVCALLLYPLCRRRLTPFECYGFCFLGYASHGLLDACTSYGTLLLWPFSDARIAWDIVSVVDPLFTIPLIVCVLIGASRRQPRFALAGLAWCALYLSLALVQSARATAVAFELAASRGHAPERIEVKPAFASAWLWKTIYEYRGRFYVDAVRVLLEPEVFPGESLAKLELERDFPWLAPGTQQWRDVERFGRFADDYLALDDEAANRVVDMRYSLVPNRGDGLWAIELDPAAAADTHASYVTMRWRPAAEGRKLLEMMF
jgi:inner membrane protein